MAKGTFAKRASEDKRIYYNIKEEEKMSEKKRTTGFPLADQALGMTAGAVTTGMGMKALSDVGGVAAYGSTFMGMGLMMEAVPKKRKR